MVGTKYYAHSLANLFLDPESVFKTAWDD